MVGFPEYSSYPITQPDSEVPQNLYTWTPTGAVRITSNRQPFYMTMDAVTNQFYMAADVSSDLNPTGMARAFPPGVTRKNTSIPYEFGKRYAIANPRKHVIIIQAAKGAGVGAVGVGAGVGAGAGVVGVGAGVGVGGVGIIP